MRVSLFPSIDEDDEGSIEENENLNLNRSVAEIFEALRETEPLTAFHDLKADESGSDEVETEEEEVEEAIVATHVSQQEQFQFFRMKPRKEDKASQTEAWRVTVRYKEKELVPRAIVYHHYHRRRSSRTLEEMTCGEASCHCVKFTCKSVFSSIGFCAMVVGYVVFGAYVFHQIEGNEEARLCNETIQMRQKLHKALISNVTDYLRRDTYNCNLVQMEVMIEEFKAFFDSQLMIYEDKQYESHSRSNCTQHWTMASSVLYATTVITTIGYGNLVPKTNVGKLATIFYALIGVPLMLITLASMGNFMATCFRFTYTRCCAPLFSCMVRVFCHPPTPRRPANSSPRPGTEARDTVVEHIGNNSEATRVTLRGRRRRQSQEIPIYLTLTVITVYLIGISMLFKEWENWTWLNAIYFCFITFSTIGFGDIVPGRSVTEPREDSYKSAICAVAVLFGLVIMSMCFNLMQDTVSSYFRSCCRRCRSGNDEEEEDDREESFMVETDKPVSQALLRNEKNKGKRRETQSPV